MMTSEISQTLLKLDFFWLVSHLRVHTGAEYVWGVKDYTSCTWFFEMKKGKSAFSVS